VAVQVVELLREQQLDLEHLVKEIVVALHLIIYLIVQEVAVALQRRGEM
jgi:hypothetical protein